MLRFTQAKEQNSGFQITHTGHEYSIEDLESLLKINFSKTMKRITKLPNKERPAEFAKAEQLQNQLIALQHIKHAKTITQGQILEIFFDLEKEVSRIKLLGLKDGKLYFTRHL